MLHDTLCSAVPEYIQYSPVQYTLKYNLFFLLTRLYPVNMLMRPKVMGPLQAFHDRHADRRISRRFSMPEEKHIGSIGQSLHPTGPVWPPPSAVVLMSTFRIVVRHVSTD
jgi:hypothetical protein